MQDRRALEAEIRRLRLALESTVMTPAKESEVRSLIVQRENELAQAPNKAATDAASATTPRSIAEIEVEIRTLRWVLGAVDLPPSEAAKLHVRIAEGSAELAKLRPSAGEFLRPGPNDDSDDDDDGPRRGGGYPSTTGRPSGGGRWND